MKIVFVSNYFNHHQKPFSEEMHKLTNNNYYFVAMEKMSKEREQMGWKMDNLPTYVLDYSENSTICNKLIFDADVVICACGYELFVKQRLISKKLVFFYSERWHKSGYNNLKTVKHILVNYFKYNRFKNCYMLCSSAFTSYDCGKSLSFINKCYKWGYFPEFVEYDDLQSKNSKLVPSILFVSRLIDWKHPELPLMVVKRLKNEGIDCDLTMIGTGPLTNEVIKYITQTNLDENVKLVSSVPSDQVRTYMKNSDIFLFTSDRNEGWGAVLNEAMNSGCAVVASSEIGSVPYLLNDGVNGYIYEDGNFEDLYQKTKEIITNESLQTKYRKNAYETIKAIWNANVAANRLLALSDALLSKNNRFIFEDGPCSIAEKNKDKWFKGKYR